MAILAVVWTGTGERPGSSVTRTVRVFNVGDTGSRARSRSSERERYLYLALIQRHHLPQTLFKQGLRVPRFFVRRVLGGFLFRLSENCILFFGRRGRRFIRKRRSPGEDGQRQKAAYFLHDESLMCKRLWKNQAH